MTSSTTGIHYRPHQDPRSSHQQILKLVRDLARDRGFAPVLDVGCAQGMLGHALRRERTFVTIDGIELNPDWAELARPAYRTVWSSRIEQAPIRECTYKLVVCGDVLEHLADPVGVLNRLRRACTPDAKFIISVPNVAHAAVRAMLLFGRFPKMERGILDRTHLQFLTKHTATQLLRAAGLTVESASVTGVPIDEIWKSGEGKLLFKWLVKTQHGLLNALPGLFGYQWIFVASAPPPPTGKE